MEKEILEITALAYGGKAVGRRANGKVCFLRGVLPGEKAAVSIVEEKKNYSLGSLLEILEPVKERHPHPCPCGGVCPSCPYGFMDYEMEWEWKQKQFASFLEKLKNIHPAEVRKGVPASERWHYRNKIKLALERAGSGKLLAGYRGEDNITLIPVTSCLLAEKEILKEMEKAPYHAPSFREEKSITFRHTGKDGVKILREKSPSFPLTESLGKYGEFLTGSNSFFQINRNMAEKLAESFLAILEETAPQNLVELYCGCGVFSCLAAEKMGISTIGIELDKANTLLAKENALSHHAGNKCRFICGDASGELEKLQKEGGKKRKLPPGTLLLVDPPRTGLDKKGIDLILRSGADHLCYISCGAPTLMRDLEALGKCYTFESVRLLDLFPGTAHFESISLLRRI